MLAGMLVWWNFLGREGCNGQGKATALSAPLISLLQSNCTERCVSHTSHQTPSSHLLYQINHREKTSACPGWCFSICQSLGRCFREGFDVGFPGQGWLIVLQDLDLGRVFPATPIGNELECFILVSDTFLSKHPRVPVMCN